MEYLEETTKKHNMNLNSCSKYTSHGSTISTFGFYFKASSYFNECLLDFEAYDHIDKDKYIFSSLNEFNTEQTFFGD